MSTFKDNLFSNRLDCSKLALMPDCLKQHARLFHNMSHMKFEWKFAVHSHHNYGMCRIRTERNGGAWCPKQQISRDVYEWLEIDLGQLTVVTQVETQGRFGNGQVSSANES